jgi:LPXTG-motif cell wall-anchored protein
MSHDQLLAKGAGEGTPPFWIIAVGLVVIVGVAFLVGKARKR